MNTTAPTPISLTSLRRAIHDRKHDGALADILQRHFDPIPAGAMRRHRMPRNKWREAQIDGTEFHEELTAAVKAGTSPANAPKHLRPALSLLERYQFIPMPEVSVDELLLDDPQTGLRGKADLAGWAAGDREALIEIKTTHDIPTDYPYLEHSVQAAALYPLVWGHAPEPRNHFVRVLYVSSTAPHRAYLLEVQMPHVFCRVAADLATHLQN